MIYLSREQVRMVDRLAVERYRIPSILLMENAARGATALAMKMVRRKEGASALVLAGGGNNGGDGLAIARHLHNSGVQVEIGLCVEPEKYSGDALINYQICQAMGLAMWAIEPDRVAQAGVDLIVDAIFGTGLTKPPRGPFGEWVAAIEASGKRVLAVDLPSGLDCDMGEPLGPACIRATETMTFVAWKSGFSNPRAVEFTGIVHVAEIGAPKELVDVVRREAPGFGG